MDIMIPEELHYTEEHEWVVIDKDRAVIGITDYAQQKLGDITFIELPELGREVKHSDIIAEIESVKAASDIYSPVTGTIVEVNTDLEENPGLINDSPYKKGWVAELELASEEELDELMDSEDYKIFTDGLE